MWGHTDKTNIVNRTMIWIFCCVLLSLQESMARTKNQATTSAAKSIPYLRIVTMHHALNGTGMANWTCKTIEFQTIWNILLPKLISNNLWVLNSWQVVCASFCPRPQLVKLPRLLRCRNRKQWHLRFHLLLKPSPRRTLSMRMLRWLSLKTAWMRNLDSSQH